VRIAVISDVHGNLGALEAVLADINNQNVEQILNLGDALSGPLLPAECADRLIPLGLPTIRGNHERQLLTLKVEEMGPSDRYTAACLHPDHFRWIARFPERIQLFDEVLLVHGTPHSDLMYFLETVEREGLRRASLQEVSSRAAGVAAELILCGHTHIPRSVRLLDGRLIVNPGSVGLPAYQGDWPFSHEVQMGSPHARYAIVEKQEEKWSSELRAVAYDWERSAIIATQRGRPDWAHALRTGLI
jgi:predicted phosphodiesterase